MQVSWLSGLDPAEDELIIRNQGTGPGEIGLSGSTVSYEGTAIGTYLGGLGGADLIIVLNANATHAATAALISNIMFVDTDVDDPTPGSRVIRFELSDGGGEVSTPSDATVTVSRLNDAPLLAGIEPGPIAYVENDAATPVSASITITDVDSPTLAGADVAIAASYTQGEDFLEFTDTASISGSFNPATGVLTLSGADSVAAYQAALRSISYGNGSDNPSTSMRTIEFTINDGTLASNTLSRNITITAVNDPPVIASDGGGALANITVPENATLVTTVTVNDPDSVNPVFSIIGGNDAAQFTIDPATGVVSFLVPHDYEAPSDLGMDNNYRVIVRATDGQGGNDAQTLSVTVVNADEGGISPIADTDPAAESLAENALNGSPVGFTASATDPDAATDTITFSLDADAGGRFAIDPLTGIVTLVDAANIDREIASSHPITVRASSSDGTASTTDVTIQISDVNDSAPSIDSQTLLVAEGSALGDAVGVPSVSDPDTTGTLQGWIILGGSGAGVFDIDAGTGLITGWPIPLPWTSPPIQASNCCGGSAMA
ncbi:MAG: cadherin domain-containing protein [Burkholderiaceae bacterium]